MRERDQIERARRILTGLDEPEAHLICGLRMDKIAMLRNELPAEYAAQLGSLLVRMAEDAESREGELNLTRVVWAFVHTVSDLILDYHEDARSPQDRERAVDELIETLMAY